MKIKFYNAKDVLCLVTYMEDTMNVFEEDTIMEDLDEEESKSTPKKKNLS